MLYFVAQPPDPPMNSHIHKIHEVHQMKDIYAISRVYEWKCLSQKPCKANQIEYHESLLYAQSSPLLIEIGANFQVIKCGTWRGERAVSCPYNQINKILFTRTAIFLILKTLKQVKKYWMRLNYMPSMCRVQFDRNELQS